LEKENAPRTVKDKVPCRKSFSDSTALKKSLGWEFRPCNILFSRTLLAKNTK
jgi:hypothetical protein